MLASDAEVRGEFLEGLFKSGTMILISEIGDKTFFIAAIMAMRHARTTVRPDRRAPRAQSRTVSFRLCPPHALTPHTHPRFVIQ